MPTAIELRAQEYDARLEVTALRRAVFEDGDQQKTNALVNAELQLEAITNARIAAEKEAADAAGKLPVGVGLLGAQTTGLEATADLRMAQIPTSLVHLFTRDTRPLLEVKVKNHDTKTRRVSCVSFVDGYSAHAVDTYEISGGKDVSVPQIPTFFRERLDLLDELTRATVNVEVRDLDGRIELQKTLPVWLLAKTTAPLAVPDPANGTLVDMTRYLGAFVTPNAPPVMAFARQCANFHPKKQLVGYQIDKTVVKPQIESVFNALKDHGIVYINSVIDFTPEHGTMHQRVRLPRETLADKQANCIDGTLLMASLLEAISLNPALVIIPGHAFLGWETWKTSGEWQYVETTMIGSDTFDAACKRGDQTAATWSQAAAAGKPQLFRRWSLRELRSLGITPRE